jgi:predicted amidohydrolase
MKTAVVQMNLSESVEENRDKIIEFVDRALREGVGILCFPETALTGYLFDDFTGLDFDQVNRALDSIHERVRDTGLHVILPTALRENGTVYNSAVLLMPGGERLVYHKNYLVPYEETWFTAGSRPLVFETQSQAGAGNSGGAPARFGVVICRDQNFPEACALPAREGARGVFICSAHYYQLRESRLKRVKNTALPIARAYENKIFVFKSNAVGTTRGMISLGGSLIVDSCGIVACEAGEHEETMLVYDIDFSGPNPSW